MATASKHAKAADTSWRLVWIFTAIFTFAFFMDGIQQTRECDAMCEAKGGEWKHGGRDDCLCRDAEGVFTPYRIKE